MLWAQFWTRPFITLFLLVEKEMSALDLLNFKLDEVKKKPLHFSNWKSSWMSLWFAIAKSYGMHKQPLRRRRRSYWMASHQKVHSNCDQSRRDVISLWMLHRVKTKNSIRNPMNEAPSRRQVFKIGTHALTHAKRLFLIHSFFVDLVFTWIIL